MIVFRERFFRAGIPGLSYIIIVYDIYCSAGDILRARYVRSVRSLSILEEHNERFER